ncbi:MAG TPA: hypothetical protein VFV92_12835 [Candidatus Bathyarchaeia archaeon]|nr:hypothetical protein [Candidatus Bathyarchaeia archaeon]
MRVEMGVKDEPAYIPRLVAGRTSKSEIATKVATTIALKLPESPSPYSCNT